MWWTPAWLFSDAGGGGEEKDGHDRKEPEHSRKLFENTDDSLRECVENWETPTDSIVMRNFPKENIPGALFLWTYSCVEEIDVPTYASAYKVDGVW